MDKLIMVAQVVIALGILNVWLLRFDRSTEWRGGGADSMKEEFEAYGLPSWFVGVVGFFKVLCAILLLVGIWVPAVTLPAALGLAVLMLGAVAMHLRIGDPLKRSLPALSVFVLCLAVILASAPGTGIG